MYIQAAIVFVFCYVASQMSNISAHNHAGGHMNGTMNNNNTMNHTMPGHNNTMPGHNHTMPGNNHTMPGGHNHTMPSGHNHTMPGQNHTGHNHTGHGTNHTGHGTNHTGHNHTADHNHTDHTDHTTSHESGHSTYFMTTNNLVLFFKDWKSESSSELTGMAVALAIIAWLYEAMKVLKQYTTKKQLMAKASKADFGIKSSGTCGKIGLHLLQTLLHVVHIFIGYLLMLGFMTYNTYLCVAIMVGFALGYLCFGWILPTYLLYDEHDTCCT